MLSSLKALAGITLVVACILGPQPGHADPRLQARLYFAMNAPDRPAGDAERDEDRKPAAVLDFLGIESGMNVLELMAGQGYYTEMLSAAVGYDGKVYAHNELMAMRMHNAAYEKAMTKRLAGNRLPNVNLWVRDLTDLGLEDAVDAVTLILNLHDLYIYGGEEHTLDVLAGAMRALRPGGILGIVDHIGTPEQDNTYLHRIDPVVVEELLYRAGFIITGRSTVLTNPEDDHTLHVFEPGIRGKTDRFVIRAIKPMYSSQNRAAQPRTFNPAPTP